MAAFVCGSTTCRANRDGLCMDVFHASPESCENHTDPQIRDRLKEVLDSNTVNEPRTELTANEKIALELTERWSDSYINYEALEPKDVLEAYTYFRDKLNKEGKYVC